MAIKTIEVICRPCPKCQNLEGLIRDMVKSIGLANKINIVFEFKYTPDLTQLNKYSVSAAQTPAILVNGAVEFAGKFEWPLLKRKLEAIHRIG